VEVLALPILTASFPPVLPGLAAVAARSIWCYSLVTPVRTAITHTRFTFVLVYFFDAVATTETPPRPETSSTGTSADVAQFAPPRLGICSDEQDDSDAGDGRFHLE